MLALCRADAAEKRRIAAHFARVLVDSGERALVERVAESANNARIAELTRDAELARWLDEHGLTLAEAARIQPSYGGPCWRGHEYVCDQQRSKPPTEEEKELNRRKVQLRPAAEAFCEGAPFADLHRAVVIDDLHARIVEAYGVRVTSDVIEVASNASPGPRRVEAAAAACAFVAALRA